jgi:hypothetical protein
MYRSYTFVVNSPPKNIHTAIATKWETEQEKLVKKVTIQMQEGSVAPENAKKIATDFVSALEKINGPHPSTYPSFDKITVYVNALISELPLTVRQMFLEYEKKNEWYSEYLYKYMQVRIQPIVVTVGGDVPDPVFDWGLNNLNMVTSPIELPDLEVSPAELKACFKRLVANKTVKFWQKMSHSSEQTYVRRALNVFLHKMFEKSGIELTGQTPEQIRNGVLKNVKHCKGLRDFSAIDEALREMIDFLSQTYVKL